MEARTGVGDGYLELEWAPGTAQGDYGGFEAVVAGERLRLKLLVVCLPYSMCLVKPYLRRRVRPSFGFHHSSFSVFGAGTPLVSWLAEHEWATAESPKQVEYLASYLEAKAASKDASKRAQLLRRCGLSAPKTFGGYDWSAVSLPEGLGRDDLLSLPFLDRREDLVLMGDVGTGKTHMASALCQLACERRLEARFFTAPSLVMRLRRARGEGRLDREISQIARARLLVIDELGFLPLCADGARLVFQVFADAYERQSVVITTNLEFSRWGGSSGATRWPSPSSTAWCTTAGSSSSAGVVPREARPHAGRVGAQNNLLEAPAHTIQALMHILMKALD